MSCVRGCIFANACESQLECATTFGLGPSPLGGGGGYSTQLSLSPSLIANPLPPPAGVDLSHKNQEWSTILCFGSQPGCGAKGKHPPATPPPGKVPPPGSCQLLRVVWDVVRAPRRVNSASPSKCPGGRLSGGQWDIARSADQPYMPSFAFFK